MVTAAMFVLAAIFVSASIPAERKANKEMVERGKWLVSFGGCNDCHTPKKMTPKGPEFDQSRLLSGAPENGPISEATPQGGSAAGTYSGDLTAWAGPWGVGFAANLTSDRETGLGAWTESMFVKAIRTGKHRGDGRQILPPMPLESFVNVNNNDLKAIFAYFQLSFGLRREPITIASPARRYVAIPE